MSSVLYQGQKFSAKGNLEDKTINYSINDSIKKQEEKSILKKEIQKNSEDYEKKINWKKIAKGLSFTEIDSKIKSEIGDSKLTVLKINPEYYKFNLISSKERGEENKTAKEWAKTNGLVAVINAGMYQDDYKTNTGFMKNYDFINNGKLNEKDYHAVVAFNKKDETVPDFQIIDLKCQNWDELKKKYNSFTQGIRMIDCNQKNRWSQQNKKWSMSAIGTDKQGNCLFMFARSPYSVHDFNNLLLKSPLDIYNVMYLEGGP
ncbi:MAG: phosphodiester glycosidase family protein, partial [Candidatus Daviesbacteria bacterium]|nr:phosphodiester glycosidase family protein [Candidatus Daviesbacteria bacterium]